MESIKIKGLRSLYDTGEFKLKKINILVGINSSGKSTFLRTFPLLRQSVERKTRGPILWSGHYIDFGTFDNSVYNNKNEENNSQTSAPIFDDEEHNKKIEFTFSLNYEQPLSKRITPIEFSISITKQKNGQKSYTHKFSCEINDSKIYFEFDEDGTINNIFSNVLNWNLKKIDYKYQVTDTDTLIPLLKPDTTFIVESKTNQLLISLRNQAVGIIKSISGTTSDKKASDLFNKLTRNLYSTKEKLIILKAGNLTSKWIRTTAGWDESDSQFKFFAGIIDLYCVIDYSPKFNNALTQEFLGVRYIAPLRTSTQRYYRFQDINIDELDHQGDNIGMFISNISRGWKEKLDKWTTSEFGFTVSDENVAGHTSIKIKHLNSKNSDNMSDMGFGYSQFLPIIIQLWSISSGYENSKKRIKTRNYILAIEQPELHLHPKLQAEIASVFIKSIKLADENSISLKLIIETHSEAIVSKTAQTIMNGNIHHTEVGIHCFEQDSKERKTNIINASFTENGTITNWPFGFFEYV